MAYRSRHPSGFLLELALDHLWPSKAECKRRERAKAMRCKSRPALPPLAPQRAARPSWEFTVCVAGLTAAPVILMHFLMR